MTKITFWIATKISTREREKYLHDAINSVFEQVNPNWELIISNDNSPITLDFSIYLHDERVKVYNQKNTLDIFANFNFCLENTKTELFIPFWDDDILEKDFVEKVLYFYENNKEKNIELICFNYMYSLNTLFQK